MVSSPNKPNLGIIYIDYRSVRLLKWDNNKMSSLFNKRILETDFRSFTYTIILRYSIYNQINEHLVDSFGLQWRKTSWALMCVQCQKAKTTHHISSPCGSFILLSNWFVYNRDGKPFEHHVPKITIFFIFFESAMNNIINILYSIL